MMLRRLINITLLSIMKHESVEVVRWNSAFDMVSLIVVYNSILSLYYYYIAFNIIICIQLSWI